jgi:hypothetical protein
MKPLLRYTIGPASEAGFQVLKMSVGMVRKLYPEFDIAICYNELPQHRLDFLKTLSIELIDQRVFKNSLSWQPTGAAWPLYPPRLRLEAHEIFMDNDIVLYNRVPQIDEFLLGNRFLVSEDFNRLYGQFRPFIPSDKKINSGLFGLPPNYDFGTAIEELFARCPSKAYVKHHDFQGIVTYCVLNAETIMIPLDEVKICGSKQLNVEFGKSGIHFCAVNGLEDHPSWNQFLTLKVL